jgi:hypothetical protein
LVNEAYLRLFGGATGQGHSAGTFEAADEFDLLIHITVRRFIVRPLFLTPGGSGAAECFQVDSNAHLRYVVTQSALDVKNLQKKRFGVIQLPDCEQACGPDSKAAHG